MNIKHPWLAAAATIAVTVAIAVQAADQTDKPPGRGGHAMGPPPEALTACQGKAAGDKLTLTLRDGRVVAGTCQLMFRPDSPPGR